MILISGPSKKNKHLGFFKNQILRPLCGAKFSNYKATIIYNSGIPNCSYCKKRLEKIQRMISSLGVEWVCEGRWLPLETRTYKDNLNICQK
jgi:hypothetical protein